MTIAPRIVLAAAVSALAALAACGDGGPSVGAGADAPVYPDSPAIVYLPTWKLEDIQPLSPRTGQTYGVDTFSGQIVVVTLVEGF
jgi:hypothetical protein